MILNLSILNLKLSRAEDAREKKVRSSDYNLPMITISRSPGLTIPALGLEGGSLSSAPVWHFASSLSPNPSYCAPLQGSISGTTLLRSPYLSRIRSGSIKREEYPTSARGFFVQRRRRKEVKSPDGIPSDWSWNFVLNRRDQSRIGLHPGGSSRRTRHG